jgi:hypothetical protein
VGLGSKIPLGKPWTRASGTAEPQPGNFKKGGLGHGPLKNAELGLGGPGIGSPGGDETTQGRVFSGFLSLVLKAVQ